MTATKARKEKEDWTEKVKGWTANHFSIADSDANTSWLLRKVADSIDELGNIQVVGITYHFEAGYPKDECTMTVYFHFPDEGEPTEKRRKAG